MFRGIPISPGVAVARAHRLDQITVRRSAGPLDSNAITAEVLRFEQACAAAADELDGIVDRLRAQVGEEQAAIFRAHRQLLREPGRDTALVAKVKKTISHQRLDAASALQSLLDEYTAMFAQIADPYLRERFTDIKDVVQRVQTHLAVKNQSCAEDFTEPVILVAREVLPSQAVMFERLPLAGIATESGGPTGHAAILARALGIPSASGLTGLVDKVNSGDLLVLDGREGIAIVEPGAEVEAAYRKLQREFVVLRERIFENAQQPAVTADGQKLQLLANVNGLHDAQTAARVGGDGVGLYRTEFLFLTHQAVPDEEEQFATYRSVIEAAPNKTVTIRTLDLGGDKHVRFLGERSEANPFMGWRSIRLRSAYPELFQTQLRAILRAANYGNVSVMFPMVSTLEETRQLRQLVIEAKTRLQRTGARHAEEIPFGIMIEVPAAALCIEHLLDEVDFVSIGSNDLTQYVMAADRDNPKVAHLCEPFNPAVYSLLHRVIGACVERNKPVTLCGEMAARPRCVAPLIGMGLRRFSMSPAFVPSIKELAHCLTLADAKDMARAVTTLRTVDEIRDYLTHGVRRVCPNVAFLDTTR
jgi:phosphoenolpyruvate-protein phosphotransferase